MNWTDGRQTPNVLPRLPVVATVSVVDYQLIDYRDTHPVVARGRIPMNRFNLLVTGDYWHADFRTALSQTDGWLTLVPLDQLVVDGRVLLPMGTGHESSRPPVDLIAVAASRREQFSADVLEQLRQSVAPLPVVALLGSWCEGEMRSGQPWPGIPRVYWHQWVGRFEEFKRAWQHGHPHPWQLPPTANPADVAITHRKRFRIDPAGSARRHSRVIAVSATTAQQFEMLADALVSLQMKPYWMEAVDRSAGTKLRPAAVVIDGDAISDVLLERVRQVRAAVDACPTMVVVGYPRAEAADRWHGEGVDAVLSKPFELDDLQAALQRLLHGSAAGFTQ